MPTATDVSAFAVNGYAAVDRITTDDEVAWLRDVYDRVLEASGTLRLLYAEGERRIDQIFLPDAVEPALRDTTYLARAHELAAEALGLDVADVENGGMMFIAKPAGQGLDTPFHQDEAYWDFDGRRLSHSCSVWMPLDDVTVDSGCMQFVPGTHLGEVRNHRKQEGLPLVLDPPADTSGAVPCPLDAGGATVHHCRTIHGTAANTSDRDRRAITTIFHGPPGVRAVPLERPWLA